ncbi:hypothetical protein AAFF_G00385790 [Aldrovandia affinis]|uniref:Uncharacterized protein n=1 Tax=Aldrovandia affinis TaxID=143900 RepID=A0AAD7SF69_9TELE|nr:hypothetical protein AAFF_G00385790 [Aldrovandia affinis]
MMMSRVSASKRQAPYLSRPEWQEQASAVVDLDLKFRVARISKTRRASFPPLGALFSFRPRLGSASAQSPRSFGSNVCEGSRCQIPRLQRESRSGSSFVFVSG